MKINPRNPKHWLLLAQQAAFTWLAIVFRAVMRKPARPLAVLYGHQLSGNLRAIYAEWINSGDPSLDLCFLSLDPNYSAQLEGEGVHLLRCNRLSDMLRLGRASVIVTDHGLHLMKPLLRFTDIRFVDVWHGIPFKGFTPNDFHLQHLYDEVWVSSPTLKSLYTERFGFDPAKVQSLGYARTDQLFKHAGRTSAFRSSLGLSSSEKIVLYAPTWQQDDANRTLFPFGTDPAEFIQRLTDICHAQGARLAIRAHLNTLAAMPHSDQVIYCHQREFPDTEDVLLGTDLLLCDWSSIAFDFLATQRPTVFLDVPPPFRNGFSLGPEYRFGAVAENLEAMEQSLRLYLATPEQFGVDFKDRLEQVTLAAYGNPPHGNAARDQLERLKTLL